ncbi:MAG: histone deacetylase 1 [Amphiamblys sp. WSBS2006]|nr:MAG: histone deacetylase 1 [Amphiamblys sp. WSBS2006]
MGSRVSYFYDDEIGNFNYGRSHPMKPYRIEMAHSLVVAYDIHEKMQIFRPPRATQRDMAKYHTDEYIEFLQKVTPETIATFRDQAHRFNVTEDSPAFDGLYTYCQMSAGASVAGAIRLNHSLSDITINWAGGLHHAKKSEASGFCYVNDIVLGILELLKYHTRVLYIDIDVHHGDGVEEAFYTTDRVMTASFHQEGEFFPGTGVLTDTGYGKGKRYSVNVPLKEGVDDITYEMIFKDVIGAVLNFYRPGAVVLQSGADSLAGDRLGSFNLSSRGHASCLQFLKKQNIPILVLGGGGYTVQNVARCWAYETAVAADISVETDLRYTEHSDFYFPEPSLIVHPGEMENKNTPEYLNHCREYIIESLREITHAPSVQQGHVPDDFYPIKDRSEQILQTIPGICSPTRGRRTDE